MDGVVGRMVTVKAMDKRAEKHLTTHMWLRLHVKLFFFYEVFNYFGWQLCYCGITLATLT